MKTKSPQLDWREGRRRRAWELQEQGWQHQDIAAALGVTAGAISPWLKRGLVARAVAGPRKKAADEGRTVVWVDPSGCSLLPLAVRTWAPCGQTPIWRVPLTHDHLAASSGSTANGRLFLQTQDQAPGLPLPRWRALPAPAAAHSPWQAPGDLGRRAD